MTREIEWVEIESAVRKALLKCPESGKPHFQYVHLWDIVYYLDLPLEKEVIMNLLKMIQTDYIDKVKLAPGFDMHLETCFEEWGHHLMLLKTGEHERSLRGIWRVIKFFREEGIKCPLIGLRRGDIYEDR